MEKKQRQRYNKELLYSFCQANNITLLQEYDKLNSQSIIEGHCIYKNCNEKFCKTFFSIINTGAFCVYHIKLNAINKTKQTCLEKFGHECSLHNEEIKQKVDKTWTEKYGGNPFQNEEIKEKSKQTCLEKFGGHPMKNKKIKEKIKETFIEKYGVDHPSHMSDHNEKIKNTSLKRYGVEHFTKLDKIKEKIKEIFVKKYGGNPLQNEEIKEKSKQTCLKKYGVEHFLKNSDNRQKINKTCLKKYGGNPFQNEEIKEKSKQTCLRKYGVEYYAQTEECKEKSKQTCLERFGVEHPIQNTEIMEKITKNCFKVKQYTLPSGNVINYQGYENYALDELLNIGISESDIINGSKNVPEIWYFDDNNTKRRHFVDIFIPSQNKCIEVKSTWTEKMNKGFIFHKQNAAKQLGYAYEIWVYNDNGEKVKTHC